MTRARLVVAAALVLIPGSMDTVWAGDGVVALQTADASCPDDSGNIYVDCGNGTVTDNRTGLVWLADANCLGATLSWSAAMEFAASLSDIPDTSYAAGQDCGLANNSSPGEWRLPSVVEWEAMIQNAKDLSCTNPSLTNDAGLDCWEEGPGSSFTGVAADFFWSASSRVPSVNHAWIVNLSQGSVWDGIQKSISNNVLVWPVRGGQ